MRISRHIAIIFAIIETGCAAGLLVLWPLVFAAMRPFDLSFALLILPILALFAALIRPPYIVVRLFRRGRAADGTERSLSIPWYYDLRIHSDISWFLWIFTGATVLLLAHASPLQIILTTILCCCTSLFMMALSFLVGRASRRRVQY